MGQTERAGRPWMPLNAWVDGNDMYGTEWQTQWHVAGSSIQVVDIWFDHHAVNTNARAVMEQHISSSLGMQNR